MTQIVAQTLAEMREAVAEYARTPRPADVPLRLKTLDWLLASESMAPEERAALTGCRAEVVGLLEGPVWWPGCCLPPA